MPKFDGTGPCGMGPMTGYGKGDCSGDFSSRPRSGRGQGQRFRRFCAWPGFFQENQNQALSLEDQKKALEAELSNIEKELAERKK
jgi:hypothetical protein